MRVPEKCDCGGRRLTYATVQSERYTIRYRRCDSCGETSKSIQIRSLSSNKSIDVALPTETIQESHLSKE
jgi:hypothetical protein